MENTQNDIEATNTAQSAIVDTSLFTVSGVLSSTWRTLFKNPVVFFGLSVLTVALEFIVVSGVRTLMPGSGNRFLLFFQFFIEMLFGQWIGGAIAYGVYQTLKGNVASLWASLFHGMRRLVPLIFVGIIGALGIFLGFILFIIPGLILMCMWEVAIPACVVERLGASESLFRSESLTKGCRMKIFGLRLIVLIAAQIALRSIAFAMPSVGLETLVNFQLFAASIPWAFDSVMTAVIYYELRNVKEGVTVDSLANVFD